MDIATFFGVLTGFGLVVGAIMMGPEPGKFFDIASVMIVFGGTGASILVTFPLEEVLQAVRGGFKAFGSKRVQAQDVVNTMVRIAEISRREGLIALENVQTENALIKKACQLIADNADPGLIRGTVAIEIASMKRRHNVSISVFNRLGGYAPAFGMIGTLIGLVQMLATLNDPSSIGPSMAVAIITTFYGALLSNLLFLPIAGKLKARSMQEELHLLIIFEGAKCILENNNPRLVYEKLSSFLPPKERKDGR
ncbi:motility protein A [Nitratidesulfovibrio sp. HK-II]|uniref:motility protein A n=1 Tax=Nitratidesulfovibrio sp. HK-II TaxID=2009266 RepID=UPI000E2E467A|nr:motility protein A [Nitratidesulfovibrio sp. HK-II]GBO95552.1 flagellar motor rotation protein MotA [Nitratidesulfovibrio sp. HK-II]